MQTKKHHVQPIPFSFLYASYKKILCEFFCSSSRFVQQQNIKRKNYKIKQNKIIYNELNYKIGIKHTYLINEYKGGPSFFAT